MNSRDKYKELTKGPVERFDQRNDMFRRARYDPEWMERATKFYGPMQVKDKPGYALEFQALQNGAWYLERNFGMGVYGSNHDGLLAWETTNREKALLRPDLKIDASDLVMTTKKIKAAARHYGASLVGVCELDRRWVYSHVSDDLTRGHEPMEIPGEYRYAIAMAIEMDYNLVKTSPTAGAAAATGIGYSKMAFIAGLLAQFIRGLGFKAIPCGNDTALSIPIAIEAGLGELGQVRIGVLPQLQEALVLVTGRLVVADLIKQPGKLEDVTGFEHPDEDVIGARRQETTVLGDGSGGITPCHVHSGPPVS